MTLAPAPYTSICDCCGEIIIAGRPVWIQDDKTWRHPRCPDSYFDYRTDTQ